MASQGKQSTMRLGWESCKRDTRSKASKITHSCLVFSGKCLTSAFSFGPQCAHADPCFPGSSCINTMPGFHCETCPQGYKGTGVSGVGIDYARASKQVSWCSLY